ncbi:solute carrier family 15 member 1-like isoform X3 [Agrilus planipennis]|uniref:Solute carrier family 15 member 1-like isoform X3 n=1 Tax=Agrilus planipennis TaxID=224129 RepID=A0A1W4WKB9_AGRPL|nr:solute carrier family 15 member 1-like isoform X3 [Agrilus planipennis]
MDTTILGSHLVPDQMQVINPAIVLILIPIFDRLVFPCLGKLNCLDNPLHRMAIGGLIAGMAFSSAGIVELALAKSNPALPGKNQSALNVINTLPCDLIVEGPFDLIKILTSGKMLSLKNLPAHIEKIYNVTLGTTSNCDYTQFSSPVYELQVEAVEKQVHTVLISINEEDEITVYTTEAIDYEKSISGRPKVRIAYIHTSQKLHNVTVTIRNAGGMSDIYFIPNKTPSDLSVSAYMELPVGIYDYSLNSDEGLILNPRTIYLALGGVYTLVLRERDGVIEFSYLFVMSPPNSVNILWLLPQYFIVSMAEIMFGVAGLEFSLTQAPKSLKTITLAAWYLSVAMGNLIVIVIAKFKIFTNQANEFFFFSALIVADMVVFTLMAEKYKFVNIDADSSEDIVYFKQEGKEKVQN